jgi:biotin carboxylase
VEPGAIPADLPFPAFVKPVKGSFSMLARRVEDAQALGRHLEGPAAREYLNRFVILFEALRERLAPELPSARSFLVEGCLAGRLVTVEGYAAGDDQGLLGIVDSRVDPATGSFTGFTYPSELPPRVQERLWELAARVARAHGLGRTVWNVELFYDPLCDDAFVVEVNPRAAAQFADLYEKVDGVNLYEVAIALALGESPPRRRGAGTFRVASSTPLRVFRPSVAARVPDPARVAAVERAHPGTLVWVECGPGQVLSDFATLEDGSSARYAVVNQGAQSREQLAAALRSIERDLGFVMEPLSS